MIIRPATSDDFAAMWPIFRKVVAKGDSYAFAPGTPEAEARAFWFGGDAKPYVGVERDRVVGMYKLAPNQPGLGAHVANAGYMVDPSLAGRGLGRALGLHSLRVARSAGFAAMQFNFVVSTNRPAVQLWTKLGFVIVGTLPKAFRHTTRGLVDAYVMHRFLNDLEDE